MQPHSPSALEGHPLSGLSLFRGTSEATVSRLRSLRPTRRPVDAGAVIFEAEDEAGEICFLMRLERGDDPSPAPLVSVDLAAEGSRRRLPLGRVVEGELFGELEFVRIGLEPRQTQRLTSARALTPAVVWSISIADFAALVEGDARLRGRFLRAAAGRLLDTLTGQHSRAQLDPEITLADWLVELAADLGTPLGNRVAFAHKIAQPDIAAELGVARETVSRRLKEWERAGLVATGAQSQRLEILDYDRIIRIASLRDHKDAASLGRAVEEIDHDIGCGNLLRARNLALDMLRHYPSSPHLLHRAALAAARSGDRREALFLLSQNGLLAKGDLAGLRERVERAARNPFASSQRIAAAAWLDDAFEEDEAAGPLTAPAAIGTLVEDIAALEARLLKDTAFQTGGRGVDATAAEASYRAYEALFRFGGGYYAGVNAATMAVAAGRSEVGARIAQELIDRLSGRPQDYWTRASLAEAMLVRGGADEAEAMLAEAAAAPEATDGAKASTALQLGRLSRTLGIDPAPLLAALRIARVAVISGHIFRGEAMDQAAQEAAEQAVRDEADTLLQKERLRYVYGPLACGSDVVLAEAALEAGARFHAVLPFAIEDFVRLSVDIGDPPGLSGHWRARVERVFEQASTITLMSDQRPLDRDLDGYFFHGFRFAAGLALLHAATLASDCAMIAVSDETAADNLAGTHQAIADWKEAGRRLHVIPVSITRRPPASRPRAADAFAPVVFLWPEPDGPPAETAIRALKLPDSCRTVPRKARSGAEGIAIIAGSAAEAVDISLAAASGAGLQVVGDFGPVLGRSLEPDGDLLARLRGASELSGFPSAQPLATEIFAAIAAFELGTRIAISPIGRGEARDDGSAEGTARPRASVPIYRLSLS